MRTISIRDVRGSDLEEYARAGELVGVTNHRVLIGVVVPVTQSWVEHMIDHNWSRVRQNVAEGEQGMAYESPMVTLDDVLDSAAKDEAEAAKLEAEEAHHRRAVQQLRGDVASVLGPMKPAARQIASEATKATAALTEFTAIGPLAPAGEAFNDAVKRLAAALGLAEPGAVEITSTRTVRVGDLSARVIEEAGHVGQMLALTHDRVLVGIVIPVTPRLVEFLVDQNWTRVMQSVQRGEAEIEKGQPFVMLDDVLSQRPDFPSQQSKAGPSDA